MKTFVKTGNKSFDCFPAMVENFLKSDISEFDIDNEHIKGYRSPDTPHIWLRDHTYQMKGFKYFEKDMTSAVSHFIVKQMCDGSIYDYFMESGICDRVPCESDVEFLLIEAIFGAWQATGDDQWLEKNIDSMTKALYYSMTNCLRWSKEYGMVKRPFTIDMWDFIYNPNGRYRYGGYKEIDSLTPFCIMHGDNTGMFQSCMLMAKILEYFNQHGHAEYWREKAECLKKQVNDICWNGNFLTHQIHIDPVDVDGVDEEKQLSLSNAYALNRDILSFEQKVSIIEEYQKRRAETSGECFAEWFSIHPPFPSNSFYSSHNSFNNWSKDPGNYTNGGIMPLVGGELARGALDNGFEEYGVDILQRYMKMISKTGESYLWYHPDGSPGKSSPTTLPTDGWGATAMLSAFIEGLAGVKDEFKLFKKVLISPRWQAAGINDAEVSVEYGASNTGFSYQYHKNDKNISLQWNGNAEKINFHVLLPSNVKGVDVICDNMPLISNIVRVRNSKYVDFECENSAMGTVKITYS